MARNKRTLLLLLCLAVLLLYAFVTDRPGPVVPRGAFGGIVLFTLLFTVLATCVPCIAVSLIRVFARRKGRKG